MGLAHLVLRFKHTDGFSRVGVVNLPGEIKLHDVSAGEGGTHVVLGGEEGQGRVEPAH